MKIDSRAGGIAALYALFGIVWIALSDQLLARWSNDGALLIELGQWKGFAFVLGSAALLYGAARRPPRVAAALRAQTGDTRALVVVFALLAAAIVLVGLAGVLHIGREYRASEISQLRAVADLRSHQIVSWLGERRADAGAMRADETLIEPFVRWRRGDEAARGLVVRRLDSLRSAHPHLALMLLDEQGEMLAAAGTPTRSPELSETVRAALARKAVLVSAPYPRAGRVRFDFVAPLALPAGEPGAVLVLHTNPEPFLLELAKAWPGQSASAETMLLRLADGDVHVLSSAQQPANADALLPFVQRDGGDVVEGLDHRAEPVLGVVRPVPTTDWQVLAKVDRRDVYRHFTEQAAWIVLADMLALLIGAAAVILVHQRRVVRHARRERAEQGRKLRALQLLDAVAEASRDVVFVKDFDGRYLYANAEACRVIGRSSGEVLGQRDAELFPPAEAQAMKAEDERALAAGRATNGEQEVVTVDAARTYLTTRGPLRDAAGKAIGLFGVARDITERKHSEQALRQSAMVFESTHDGVIVTDAQATIQAVNRAFSEITGYAEVDAVGKTPRLLQSGRQDADFYREMWRSLAEAGVWQGEIWNRRKSGEVYPEWLTISAVREPGGRTTHYVGVFTDLSRIKRSEAELARLAHYDPLTDLPNRRLLQLRLEHAVDRAHRHGEWLAVLSIDIDGFKTVNDSLGHHVGDELLVGVAERLRRRLREEDTLGRFGGDKFVVLLETVEEPEAAGVVARDLLAALAEPMTLSGPREALVTASVGIAIYPSDGTTASELLRDADAAMNRAKNQGRNQFCFYTGDMNVEALAKLELETALSRALERDELLLHYQPKIAARSGAVVGAEALLRWQRNGTLVPPGQFIPVAETSSLILDIGAWVIDAACRQVRAWLDAGLAVVPVAVNVSARQFVAGDLDLTLSDALRRHRVLPAYLEVEITESMLMERPDDAALRLKRLKTLGVKVSLDDFGTGYSSLAYLQRFPIDALKIDRSFVAGIGGDPDGATIVDAIIGLAHRMQVRVVAEGVETATQNAYLLAQGCDELQGYHHSPPLPAADMAALLVPRCP